jgi:hypothetical protein
MPVGIDKPLSTQRRAHQPLPVGLRPRHWRKPLGSS